MLKKGIIAIIIIIVIGIIVFAGIHFLKKQTIPDSKVINAVPINSPLIIESNNIINFFDKLQNKSSFWKDLKTIPLFKKLNKQINYFDTLFVRKNYLKENVLTRPVVISTHITGKDNINFLFLVGLTNNINENKISELIKELLKGNGIISQRNYNNTTIYDVKVSKLDIDNFSYTVSNGIFIFSFSSILVEDAVRQINSNTSLNNDKNFKKVFNTVGINAEANIYINYYYFPKFIGLMFDKEYRSYIQAIKNFSNWSELDLNIKDDIILLNGFTYTNDSASNYMNIFLNQSPVKLKIEKVFPANTSTFITLGISDFKQFSKDRIKYFKDEGIYGEYKINIDKIKNNYDIDIQKLFESFFEEEIALLYTDINDLNVNQNSFVVIKTKSKSQAEESLLKLLIAYSERSNSELSLLSGVCKIDNETSYPYYKMPVNGIIDLLFGDIFKNTETKYFSFYDNYLIFATNVKSLTTFIHANILQKTLKGDIAYSEFADNLSSKSSFYFYTNISTSKTFIKNFLSDDLKIGLDGNINTIKKFQFIAYQFFPSKNMIYNNIILQYNPVVKEKPHTIWQSHLDTTISFKPKLVINHKTDEKEIFIQDNNNNIYLINYAGRILWKIKLDEKIKSNVYQIDVFKNKKLQYLFSTRSKIYLIDRLGNNVERYPVNLRSPATNGIALFDYDNSRDYRIFVACADKKVYAYDIEGNIIKGWEFEQTEKFVYNSVQHFRIKTTDYIVFKDSLNTYIVDRRGTEKVKVKKQFPASCNNPFTFEGKSSRNKARLVTTDIKGNVIYVYFDGKVETKEVKKCSPNHFFEYKDFDGDGWKDFIYVNNNKIEIFNRKTSLLMSHTFTSEIKNKPVLYIFPNNNRKIGVVDKANDEIYLFDSDGEIYEGFPLRGMTMFSVGHLKSSGKMFNLFVGSNDGFLYNYEVY